MTTQCACSFRCAVCCRGIAHGRLFFALTGGRYACLRCVERYDLYDQTTDPRVTP